MSEWQPFSATDISQVFLEAVQCRHLIGLKTTNPTYQDIIVKPYWIAAARGSAGAYLWCYVQRVFGANAEITLVDIREWRLMTAEDMTSRRIPQKAYRDFEGHPAKHTLVLWDMALRRAWAEAASKPDFDPAPWIEKDRRLSEIANEVLTWYPEFLK